MKRTSTRESLLVKQDNKTIKLSLISLVICFVLSLSSEARIIYSKAAGGNWSAAATWTLTSGSTTTAVVPTATDTVIIERNAPVVLDADGSCMMLQVKAFSSNGTTSLTINAFTLSVGTSGVVITGGSNGNRKAQITFNSTSAVLSVNGNVTIGNGASGSTSLFVMTTGGTLSLTGTLSRNATDGVFTQGAGTVNYNGSAAAQTVSFTNLNYNNLTLSNTHSSGVTLGAAITSTNVTGNINIAAGIFKSADLAITLGNSKTFTVAAGATYNGGTSTITFGTGGTATINGTFNTSNTNGFSGASNSAISSTNSPTINQGTSSSIGMSGTQSISSGTYNSLTINSSGTVTASGALTISGDFTMSSGTFDGGSFTHNVSGDWVVSGGTFTSTGTTINFNGSAAQAISSTVPFNNVTINNSNGVSLSSAVTVNGTLTLTSGKISIGSNNLTIGTAGSISGANATNYIVANGAGSVVQQVAAGGSKSYPVGTATLYLPATIALTGGSTSDNFSVSLSSGVLTQGTSGNTVTSDAVAMTWNISEAAAGNSNATITLQWPGSLELSGFTRSACRLAHYTGGTWDYGTSDLVASGSDPYTVSRSGFTSFSPFSIGENVVLPVKWAYLNGSNTVSGNKIEWATASEYNNDHFEIEYSYNGSDFKLAGTVSSKGNEASKYEFLHKSEQTALVYYRIKQVDKDGKSEYSQLIVVRKELTAAALYPNPCREQLNISGATEGCAYLITDICGKEVNSGKLENSSINVSELSKGIYFVSLKNELGSKSIRFIKE